jgi:hypothetical protein
MAMLVVVLASLTIWPTRTTQNAGLRAQDSAARSAVRWSGCFPVAILVLILTVRSGPYRWGPAARFEPMAGPASNQEGALLAAIDAARSRRGDYPQPHGRTLYIDLTNYFLTKSDVTPHDIDRAVHYAELETQRDPNDARAWSYLGLAYQRQGRPVAQVRDAWQRSYRLRPDPRMAERLAQLAE